MRGIAELRELDAQHYIATCQAIMYVPLKGLQVLHRTTCGSDTVTSLQRGI